MMRYWFALILVSVFVSSCKKKELLHKVEGKWQQTKILLQDGTYVPASAVYDFGSGKPDEWLPLTIYQSDTIQYVYQPAKVEHKLSIGSPQEQQEEVLWIVEDIDKKTMVLHTPDGILFFNKM